MTLIDRVCAIVGETLPQATRGGVLDMRALRAALAPKLRKAAKDLGLPDGDPTQPDLFGGKESCHGKPTAD